MTKGIKGSWCRKGWEPPAMLSVLGWTQGAPHLFTWEAFWPQVSGLRWKAFTLVLSVLAEWLPGATWDVCSFNIQPSCLNMSRLADNQSMARGRNWMWESQAGLASHMCANFNLGLKVKIDLVKNIILQCNSCLQIGLWGILEDVCGWGACLKAGCNGSQYFPLTHRKIFFAGRLHIFWQFWEIIRFLKALLL